MFFFPMVPNIVLPGFNLHCHYDLLLGKVRTVHICVHMRVNTYNPYSTLPVRIQKQKYWACLIKAEEVLLAVMLV